MPVTLEPWQPPKTSWWNWQPEDGWPSERKIARRKNRTLRQMEATMLRLDGYTLREIGAYLDGVSHSRASQLIEAGAPRVYAVLRSIR